MKPSVRRILFSTLFAAFFTPVILSCLSGMPVGSAWAQEAQVQTQDWPYAPQSDNRTPFTQRTPLVQDDLIGEMSTYTTVGNETLLEVGVRMHVGYTEFVAANPGVDPYVPGEGFVAVLPTQHILPRAPRRGIIINLAEQRLYFFPDDGGPVFTGPIGIGDEGQNTPHGNTYVAFKKAYPTWYPPPSIRAERPDLPYIVPPGIDNPLGTHAIYLGWPRYLIHGTHKPLGVGRRVSHGCIRMLPADIPRLFAMVHSGTPVLVMYEPVKIGRHNGQLYLEVHPTLDQAVELERHYSMTPQPIPDLASRISETAPDMLHRINWDVAQQVALERRGYPVQITDVTAITSQSDALQNVIDRNAADAAIKNPASQMNGGGIKSRYNLSLNEAPAQAAEKSPAQR